MPSRHAARKASRRSFSPPSLGSFDYKFPTNSIDNWSAAVRGDAIGFEAIEALSDSHPYPMPQWKVRRFWEEQTELRKAAGKTIY